MAKKKQLGILSIILLCLAAAGVVLAVVGIAINWFTVQVSSSILGSSSESVGLFKENLGKGVDFPIAAVQAFAIITLILAALACLALLLNALGALKAKKLLRIIFALVIIVCAVLTFIFALVFASKCGSVDAGALGGASVKAAAGAYLLPIGGLLSGIPLLLGKD